MSAPWFSLPGTCAALSKHRLSWAYTRRCSTSMKRRLDDSPPGNLYRSPQSCCPSGPACDVLSGLVGRLDRPDIPPAFRGNWCADCPLLSTSGQMSASLCKELPNLCWRHLSRLSSSCRPFPEELLFHPMSICPGGQGWNTGLVHLDKQVTLMPRMGWNSWFQPELKGTHTKQAQLKHWRRCSHKTRQLLKHLDGASAWSWGQSEWKDRVLISH